MNATEWLTEVARTNAGRTFLIDAATGDELTFAELDGAARRIAGALREELPKGARVALLLGNSSAFAKLYFGCLYAGIVTVPVNPTLGPDEIAFIVRHSDASWLVVSPETAALADRDAARAAGLTLRLLEDGRRGEPVQDLERWEPELAGTTLEPFDGVAPDDTLTIVYTSGTTARPVGVVHRISSLVDNARLFNTTVGIGPENRFYGILAMTYLGGYYNLLLLPYVAAASVVLSDVFNAASALTFWSTAEKHGVNTLWVVPTIMSILLELDRSETGATWARRAVRLALVGTAPLAPTTRRAFEQRYGVRLYENYALSETTFLTTNRPGDDIAPGSVGRPLEQVALRIVRDEGTEASTGEEGEIQVRTPFLMERYHTDSPDRAGLPLIGGWFPTGDLGRLDEHGELFVTGRKKDMIIRGGVNISPAAIEQLVQEHHSVLECAVVGIAHALYGEDVAAAIRIAKGAEPERVRDEVVDLCRRRLGPSRRPAHVIVLEDFPRTSSGKVQKRFLREYVEGTLARGGAA